MQQNLQYRLKSLLNSNRLIMESSVSLTSGYSGREGNGRWGVPQSFGRSGFSRFYVNPLPRFEITSASNWRRVTRSATTGPCCVHDNSDEVFRLSDALRQHLRDVHSPGIPWQPAVT